MYLKSLVLKGFKSFVDRSVVSLEPGITVVVGPNGSGKSNISDAILWVLGEQSAKQLRGQSMEDVVFAGSSARKPAGMAEVDLVLDNSDGTLPLDFTEIAITRRMYRNGESEYLINGSPALLRDILDILHDTGIGRDTHSIISQGALTEIVEARPETRRALIEEAAGILKHKKRKERSARKIAAMEANLSRVRDIEKEVSRQLRPLERQAARAQQFNDFDSQRRHLELQLAVDDIRALQAEWEGMQKQVKEAEGAIELARLEHSERSRELEKLQKALEEKGLFVGDLAEQRSRCQSLLERLEASRNLLEEKSRNMVARASEVSAAIQKNSAKLIHTAAEAAQLEDDLREANAAYEAYIKENAELTRESEQARKLRLASDEEYNKLSLGLRNRRRQADETRLLIERAKQDVSAKELQSEMLDRRCKQLDEQLASSRNALVQRRARLEEVSEELHKAEKEAEAAGQDFAKRQRMLEYARKDADHAREKRVAARAELRGIEEIDRAFETASPSLSWVLAHEYEFKGLIHPISESFTAEEDLERLIEHLLGADLLGLVIDDADAAEKIVTRLLSETEREGELALISASSARGVKNRSKRGVRLVDSVSCSKGREGVVEALLGDVYLVDGVHEALEAQAAEPGYRFATREGVVVWPSGKITVGAQYADVEGTLARARRADELRSQLEGFDEELKNADMAVAEAESGLSAAQKASLDLSGRISQLSSEEDVVREEVGRLEQAITSIASEREEVARQLAESLSEKTSSQPLMAEYEQRIEKLNQECAEIEEKIASGSSQRAEKADAEARLIEQIQACKVGMATANTKLIYLKKRSSSIGAELSESERALEVSKKTSASLSVLVDRVDPLYKRFDELYEGVREWASKLRDQTMLEQSDSQTLRETIESARSKVASAKEAFDERVAQAADVRVALGKLETQVEAAVSAISSRGDILLEDALKIPSPEDRSQAEDQLNALKRRIAKIGPVNQVAMEQYSELKERHDFIASQVEDLESTRKALKRIDSAIERKMKSQFLSTFEAVDANFQQIFSELFPGGSAHLEFTEPDNTEQSGVAIVAQPPGKRITKNSLLSGGEMSLAALALLFAVYRTRTVPFYVLDEVEAALDDTNMRRLVTYLDSERHRSQFIIISHQRRTMEIADVLYGVSMQGDGVSKVVSQKLERAIAQFAEDATPQQVQEQIDKDPNFVRMAR